MQDTKPPFRADHVGSLLRTATLKKAREKRANGEISAAALSEVEDREIDNVIRGQEDVGLKSITDGEFRRTSWNYDFLERLEGVESYTGERKIKFDAQGPQPRAILLRVVGKLDGYTPHPMIEHFKFLKAHAKQAPKVTIPSPSSLHFRYGRDAVPESIYPAMEDFYRDLGRSYAKTVRAFADAGCRYLQLDEVNFAYLCDPALRETVIARGEDPATLPAIYAGMINAAISDIPPDMTITMHLCRGNFRSSFVASGGYEPVAETLFNAITCMAISWNMIAIGLAVSNRCASCRRARGSCSASSPPSPETSKAATTSSAGSTRRPSTSRSISSACRRNAGLLRPRKATFCPRPSNGRN
jgi:5-methyltetrahydropteroyltriglutamate--homocysteine methyltransferase